MADESIVYNVSFRREKPTDLYTFRCNRLVGSQSGEVGLHSATDLAYGQFLEECIGLLDCSEQVIGGKL